VDRRLESLRADVLDGFGLDVREIENVMPENLIVRGLAGKLAGKRGALGSARNEKS
jgi:hypothetical protein